MKKLNVIYTGWGEHFLLGVLADNGRDILFEYSTEAIKRGLDLSPFKMPLSSQTFGNHPTHQLRLPGLISDSLPDGWGMLVMDRLFRKQGRDPAEVSPLDRLEYISKTAMGALAFEPCAIDGLPPEDVQLIELVQDVHQVFEEDESEAILRKLVSMGGAPLGARPKVLVNFDKDTNLISTLESGRGTPMLVKFPAQNEHKETCAIETLYCNVFGLGDVSIIQPPFSLPGRICFDFCISQIGHPHLTFIECPKQILLIGIAISNIARAIIDLPSLFFGVAVTHIELQRKQSASNDYRNIRFTDAIFG